MRWTIAIKVLNSAMVFIVPPIGVLVVLLAREFDTGKRVSATVSFVALSLFNILRFPLVVLPKAMRAVTGMCVGGWVGGCVGMCGCGCKCGCGWVWICGCGYIYTHHTVAYIRTIH